MNKLEFTRMRGLDYASKESINTLCTNLSFAGDDTRVIMVTSTKAHEGKSFIAMNMTRAMAKLGYDVILVDMDLRRSQMVARYGARVKEGKGQGLAHYLAGRCSLDEIIYETNIAHASVIPIGHEVANSLTLLNSSRLEDMLKQLRKRYHYVIVDAPPVGIIVDAAEIAKSSDGTIFVVRYNETDRKSLLEAKQQIQRTGCRIIGAVLNDVDFDSLSNRRHYNKSYYSYLDSEYSRPEKIGGKRRKAKRALEHMDAGE